MEASLISKTSINSSQIFFLFNFFHNTTVQSYVIKYKQNLWHKWILYSYLAHNIQPVSYLRTVFWDISLSCLAAGWKVVYPRLSRTLKTQHNFLHMHTIKPQKQVVIFSCTYLNTLKFMCFMPPATEPLRQLYLLIYLKKHFFDYFTKRLKLLGLEKKLFPYESIG